MANPMRPASLRPTQLDLIAIAHSSLQRLERHPSQVLTQSLLPSISHYPR